MKDIPECVWAYAAKQPSMKLCLHNAISYCVCVCVGNKHIHTSGHNL